MAGIGNRAHRVNLCRWARPGRKGAGGRMQLFAFSWLDVAQLLGVDVRKAQRLAGGGAFDPRDLASIAAYWQKHDESHQGRAPTMSTLEIDIGTMPGTSLMVGSEGAIHVRENGAVIRIVTAAQARDLARALEMTASHSEGRLVGDRV